MAELASSLIASHQTNAVLHVIVQVDGSAAGGSVTGANASKFVHGKIRGVASKGGFIAADINPSEALSMQNRQGVRHVSFDWPISCMSSSSNAALSGTSFGSDVSESYANLAWQKGLLGDGIGIAVVDSGIGSSPDLNGVGQSGPKIVGWMDFVGGKPAPYDDYGHGTHVAGILAGTGKMSANYSTHFPGIAPDANLIGVKVLDSTGAGSTSTVIQGIDWCIQNSSTYNIRIINLSLGHPVYESYATDPLCQEVEKAWNAGIVVVVAAGNDGRLNPSPVSGADNDGYGTNYGSIESPGNDPCVITVGAMKSVDPYRPDDYITTYSSRGPTLGDDILKPDIVAYGNLVVSDYANKATLETTYAQNGVAPATYGGTGTTQYFILSGTSMATPVTAGAAALMLEANPALSPDTVKLRMMLSADKWGADALTYGSGYLNIPAALSCTSTATAPTASPQLYLGTDGLVYIDMPSGSPQLLFGSTALWGGRAVFARNALSGSSGVWGDTALWGGRTFGRTTIWSNDTTNACIFGDGGG